jgi:polysaccharide export outer membrane protein
LAILVIFSAVAAAQPVSRGYLLSPGDELLVKVLGEETLGFTATVDENGYINVPFADKPVVAKCRSESELRGEISVLLGKYLKNPQLNLQITKRTVIPVTVYGEVNKPQEFDLRRKATLIELLANSGGVKEEAGGVVQVFRPIKPACSSEESANWRSNPNDPLDVPSRTFSLANMAKGGEDVNPIIYPGDVIIVDKAAPVYITGEVLAPGGLYLKEDGLTLTQAIGKIGGFRREAKTKDIRIQRKKQGSTDIEFISVNYDLIKAKQQPDVVLQPYDIIEVDVKKDSLGVSLFKFAIGLAKQGAGALSTGTGYRVLY